MKSDFACFILTHGRPDKQYTYQSLRKSGYTGKIYLVIDDEDITGDEYRKNYGNEVLTFSKDEVAKYIDTADLSDNKKTILYARNANFDLAEKLGVKYFLQLDDDYDRFEFRFVDGGILRNRSVVNLDSAFEIIVNLLETLPVTAICFLQNGDLIGGAETYLNCLYKRKAMNSWFCKTDNRFYFRGRLNDDVNTYLTYGAIGRIFMSIGPISVHQLPTQSQAGGMTETYLEGGTYQKSFTSVMYAPSCVKVSYFPSKHKRIHHKISWNHAVPKILSDKYRKVEKGFDEVVEVLHG